MKRLMINCNIIIPTYNRPDYLRRLLNYYESFGEDFKIIVADSSSDDVKAINKKTVSSVSKLDIKYLGDYATKIDLHHKIADAVNHAEEKYCVFCGDDDFVTPDGMRQSIDFLERNPDFAVAHGQYINFHLKDDERGKQQFYWKPIDSHESILFPDAKDRLVYHLSNYFMATFYAVHRTDFMKMISEETINFTDDDRFGELLPTMLSLIYGKMKCLDVFYAVQQYSPSSAGQTSKNIRDFIKDGTYGEKYARFRECLSVHLSKQAQLDIRESEKVVDEAMSAYIKNAYTFSRKIIKMRGILNYLRLPDWIVECLRALYEVLFPPKQKPDSFYSLGISASYEYYDDLNKIRLQASSHLEE